MPTIVLTEQSSSESVEVPEPKFGKVPTAQERASTMPVTRGNMTDGTLQPPSDVMYRHLAAPQDPSKRKSGE